jgi:hypothetical protein
MLGLTISFSCLAFLVCVATSAIVRSVNAASARRARFEDAALRAFETQSRLAQACGHALALSCLERRPHAQPMSTDADAV